MGRGTNKRMLALTLVLLFSCTLLGLASWPERSTDLRLEALRLWDAQSLPHYRIGIRAEASEQTCFQQLEVRRGQVLRVLQDTCESDWLSELSVPRLFDITRQLERIPMSRCPNGSTCECHRVFQYRTITYDPQLGYPSLMNSRSEVQLNLLHPDFWNYVSSTGSLPNCAPAPRRLKIEVLWLTPMGD